MLRNRVPSMGEGPIKQYKKFRDQRYTHLASEPFGESIRPGHVLVIDNTGDSEAQL